MNIKEMIEKAEKAEACEDGIEWARQFDLLKRCWLLTLMKKQ